MAFNGYANQLQNYRGLNPYLHFIGGGDSVVVTVRLYNGGIVVEEGPDVDAYEAEVRNLKAKVDLQDKEIRSLNILLEKQKDDLTSEEVADIEASEKEFVEGKAKVFATAEEFIADLDKEEKPEKKSRRKKK